MKVDPISSSATLRALQASDHELFRGVDPVALTALIEASVCRIFEAGEELISPGDTRKRMFFVLTGKLSIHLDGVEHAPIGVAGRGQAVGELSLLLGTASAARVVATQRTGVLEVEEQPFWRLVMVSHPFATNLLFLVARRLSANNSAIIANGKLLQRLQTEARVDALTGTYNRRWLDDRLRRLVARHRSTETTPLSVLLVDVDHFKRINDELGHAAGDRVLRHVVQIIEQGVRPSDYVARYGGEEFVVILPGTPLTGACVAAERLRRAVATTPTPCSTDAITVRVSIGVATLLDGEEPAALLERADARLYAAKRGGRDRVEA